MVKINQDKNQEDIVIAAIAKYENEYLGEWIDYHLKLGFDKIYIYDDNPKDYPDIKEIPEIKKNLCKKVFIIKPLETKLYQHIPFYNKFYSSHIFKWAMFIDIDEFLVLPGFKNIKEFLNQEKFNDTVQIMFPWMFYGDSGHLKKKEGSKILKRFTKPSDSGKWIDDAKETNLILGKCAVRGNLPGVRFGCTHCLNFTVPILNKNLKSSNGEYMLFSSPKIRPDYSAPYLKHFFTKSAEEFVDKVARGYADCYRNRPLNEYFCINEFTNKKKDALLSYAQKIKEEKGFNFIWEE